MSDGQYLKQELDAVIQSDPEVFEFLRTNTLDGLWYWDTEDGDAEWMSPEFWRLFGYEPSEKKHLASEWQNMINQDDLKVALENFRLHCEDPNHKYDQIVRYTHKNGSTVWVRCRGVAIRDKDGKVIRMLGAHTDITELMRTQKSLADALARDASKTVFFANVSHELRTPLNAVIGFAELLASDPTADRAEEYASLIAQSGHDLLSLISQLLDFSRMEVGTVELDQKMFWLNDVFENQQSMFEQRALENSVKLTVGTTPNRAFIGDVTRLKQIVSNLVQNAIKFSVGGTVDLSVEVEELESQETKVRLIVTDTGIGIPKDQIPTLFEPFSRSSLPGKDIKVGAGLGLPIVRSLCRAMGGDVSVVSAPGKGSRFEATVLLKSSVETPSVPPIASLFSDQAYQRLNLHILAVDDVESNLDVLDALASGFGCKVERARDGLEAIEFIKNQKVDVILMDVHMPNLNGIAAAEQIQKIPNAGHIPIFAWTADIRAQDTSGMVNVGWAGTLLKPVAQAELYQQLKQVARVYS